VLPLVCELISSKDPTRFAVCQLPRLILRIGILLLRTSPEVHLNKAALQTSVNVASVLLVIHAAANFFVYRSKVKGHKVVIML